MSHRTCHATHDCVGQTASIWEEVTRGDPAQGAEAPAFHNVVLVEGVVSLPPLERKARALIRRENAPH
jgi:hypothetical protein